jgi:nitrous oxidase accessory protein NosD
MNRVTMSLLALSFATTASAGVLRTSDYADLTDAVAAAASQDVVLVDTTVGCAVIDKDVHVRGAGGEVVCDTGATAAVRLLSGASGASVRNLMVSTSNGVWAGNHHNGWPSDRRHHYLWLRHPRL